VKRKIENVLPKLTAAIQIARIHHQFVAQSTAHCHDFTCGRDDTALADQIAPFFAPGFGDTHQPQSVLIGARLHD
jgi:hypothetical protein